MSNIYVYLSSNESVKVFLDEGGKKTLIKTGNEVFEDLIFRIADLLNLSYDKNLKLQDLLELARRSDDYLLDPYIAVDGDSNEFTFYDTIKNYIEILLKDKSYTQRFNLYKKHASPEVLEFLDLSRREDIFATILEMIYSIMIVKVLVIATDLGINTIVLEDKIKNIRLRDRFISETKKLGYEFSILDN